jgi:hypothetical protein
MKQALNKPNDAPGEAGKRFGFNVVIACEDAATAAPACEVLGLVQRLFEEEGRVIFRWWNFEVLAIASLRELASREAATADLIIVAAHDSRTLPPEVADWMKRWLELRKNRPGALVAVLHSALKKSDFSKGMLLQLKKTAALGHLDFFANSSQGAEQRGRTRVGGAGEAARQFVMACKNRNRNATRIAGRRGAVPAEACRACK